MLETQSRRLRHIEEVSRTFPADPLAEKAQNHLAKAVELCADLEGIELGQDSHLDPLLVEADEALDVLEGLAYNTYDRDVGLFEKEADRITYVVAYCHLYVTTEVIDA